MRIKKLLYVTAAVLACAFISSCDTAKSVSQAVSLVNCSYDLDGVANPMLGGISLANVTDPSQLSAADLLKITAYLAQGKLPIAATVNIKASNPNVVAAALENLEWAIDLKGKQLLQGMISQPVNIPGKGSTTIPFTIQTDLMELTKDHSKDDLINLALNLVNAGEASSDVSVRIKPTVMIGTYPFSTGFIKLDKLIK